MREELLALSASTGCWPWCCWWASRPRPGGKVGGAWGAEHCCLRSLVDSRVRRRGCSRRERRSPPLSSPHYELSSCKEEHSTPQRKPALPPMPAKSSRSR